MWVKVLATFCFRRERVYQYRYSDRVQGVEGEEESEEVPEMPGMLEMTGAEVSRRAAAAEGASVIA